MQVLLKKLTYVVIAVFLCLPVEAKHKREKSRGKEQLMGITTNWTGAVNGNAALFDNYSNGFPLSTEDLFKITRTNNVAITSNLGTIPANSILTLNEVPGNGETVTLDTNVYVFVDVLDVYDGEVLIGGTAESSSNNLRDAINLEEGGAGVTYGELTIVHPTAYARDDGVSAQFVAVAKTAGTAGNSIDTLEDLDGEWTAATLENGAATGNNIGTITIEKGYTKNIMTSGDPAKMSFLKLNYEGNGSMYLSLTSSFSNIVINSSNLNNAITFSGVNGIFGTLEIIKGAVNNNSIGSSTGGIYLISAKSIYNAPSSAGIHTVIYMTDGIANVDALVLTWNLKGGTVTKDIKNTTFLIMTGGTYFAKSGGNTWQILGGIVDATVSANGITVLSIILDDVAGALIQNKDIDTLGIRILGE